ncbi:MAG: universal stress protein [Alphaproteobacteria bacterium]|nr:universal stress protein [Alphaproteobacteria bacterium]
MKTTIRSILVPTDFSELAESALKVAIAIAKRQRAKIILLHVIDNYAYLQPSEVFLHEIRIMPDIKSHHEESMKELAGKISEQIEIDVDVQVEEGSPADVICRVAAKKQINLIVMGTHGMSGLRKFFIGSESSRVIKNSFCPVLTIPGNWQKTDFEKVLYPVRIASRAVEKYFYARPIIEKNNSKVTLLGLAEQQNSAELEEVVLLTDQVKAQMFADHVQFRTNLVRSSDFPKTIIDSAIEFESDLIILSSTIDHNVKAFFLGPFAQQVVNHSTLPVLSIKPTESKKTSQPSSDSLKRWGYTIDLSNLGL